MAVATTPATAVELTRQQAPHTTQPNKKKRTSILMPFSSARLNTSFRKMSAICFTCGHTTQASAHKHCNTPLVSHKHNKSTCKVMRQPGSHASRHLDTA